MVQQAQDRTTAAEIRALVDAVCAKRAGANSEDTIEFERWSTWALAHADRIDPLLDDELFDLSVSDEDVFALEDHGRNGFEYGRRPSFWGGWRGR